jgi:hypothetical protein
MMEAPIKREPIVYPKTNEQQILEQLVQINETLRDILHHFAKPQVIVPADKSEVVNNGVKKHKNK